METAIKEKRYSIIAQVLLAKLACDEKGNAEWSAKHAERIAEIMATAPSGSGIDSGTKLDEWPTPDKLVFRADFHHMNDGGYYDGWTEHTITVRPSLAFGIDIHVSGRNRNGIKDYLHDVFHGWLTEEETL